MSQIEEVLKECNLEKRAANTMKWLVEDFDRNFKPVVRQALEKHIRSLIDDLMATNMKKEVVKKIKKQVPKIIEDMGEQIIRNELSGLFREKD